jgi:hypothetical protein
MEILLRLSCAWRQQSIAQGDPNRKDVNSCARSRVWFRTEAGAMSSLEADDNKSGLQWIKAA